MLILLSLDYIIQDVTNVVNKGQSKRVELVTDSMRTKVHVYRRHEALSTHELEDKNHQVELDSENDEYSSHPTIENGCTCQNSMCSCCKHLKIRKVRLDDVGKYLVNDKLIVYNHVASKVKMPLQTDRRHFCKIHNKQICRQIFANFLQNKFK